MRKLGAVREPGSRDGLTRTQAEGQLRQRMEQETIVIARHNRMTVERAGERYLHHLEDVMQRSPSTVQDYRTYVNRHLAPHFGDRDLHKIDSDDVVSYMAAKRRKGLAPKTIQNHVTFSLGAVRLVGQARLGHVQPRGGGGPAAVPGHRPRYPLPDLGRGGARASQGAGRPARPDRSGAVSGGSHDRVAARRDRCAPVERRGLGRRQGPGAPQALPREYDKPKSKRGSRSVPLADRVAGELERHFQRSAYQADDDLVFPHPETGDPYDTSKLRKRFVTAVKKAGARDDIRFHDLRHTFGARMEAAGVPLRTLQEWMDTATTRTTSLSADYQPDERREAELVERAFGGASTNPSTIPSKN